MVSLLRCRRGCSAASLVALTVVAATLSRPAAAASTGTSAAAASPAQRHRLLMAHYMPWFSNRDVSGQWGWHWTMNHFNPDHQTAGGRRDVAARSYPLIGLYDSGDPDALECQVLLMKLAGIDGVIIDWYGNDSYLDYGINNRNTERLIPLLQAAGLHFAICYEDQTVPKEIAAGIFAASDAVGHGQRLMRWMQQNLFSSPAYLRIGGRPVLLSFGTPYYNDAQWSEIFSVLPTRPLYFTENDRREPTTSVGGFDWVVPGGGTRGALSEQDSFYYRTHAWPMSIAAAFPRFQDCYKQAGVGASWGSVDDQNGTTYVQTLTRALRSSSAPVVQLVTWNDWGEGTQIEPSVEYGYRDLEATQRLRRQYVEPAFAGRPADLRLPVAWYLLRKRYAGNAAVRAKLAAVPPLILAGQTARANAILTRYEK